ncbi:MAG: hypothetical protein IKM43_03760 [Clostridia bacterium]|nr:hypothetical protein [Clostridia bacterium]
MSVMINDLKLYIVKDKIKITTKSLIVRDDVVPFVCHPMREFIVINGIACRAFPTYDLVYIMSAGAKEFTDKQSELIEELQAKYAGENNSDIAESITATISTKDLKELSHKLNQYSTKEQIETAKKSFYDEDFKSYTL